MVIREDENFRIKKYLFFLFLLVLIPYASAQPPIREVTLGESETGFDIKFPPIFVLKLNEAFEFEFHVHNKTNGVPIINGDVSCDFHLYNSSGKHILEMNRDTVSHNYDYGFNVAGGNFSYSGDYSYVILCNSSTQGGFDSVPFEVTRTGKPTIHDVSPIIIIILLPMILSLIFLIAAATMDDKQHGVLKIFLFLLSIVPFFISMHMSLITLIEFYNFEALEDLIGSTSYWMTLLFAVIISYFLIYLFYQLVHEAAQRRKERLAY